MPFSHMSTRIWHETQISGPCKVMQLCGSVFPRASAGSVAASMLLPACCCWLARSGDRCIHCYAVVIKALTHSQTWHPHMCHSAVPRVDCAQVHQNLLSLAGSWSGVQGLGVPEAPPSSGHDSKSAGSGCWPTFHRSWQVRLPHSATTSSSIWHQSCDIRLEGPVQL